MRFRSNQIYVSPELRFYLGLRVKDLIKGTEANRTIDEQADADLINLYATEHPEWVVAWDKWEKARIEHKKNLDKIENEAVGK